MEMNLYNEFEKNITKECKAAIKTVIETANDAGVRIYLIGGIVRDLILKKELRDIDLTIEGDALDFGAVLEKRAKCKIVETQNNLRTVKIKFNSGVIIDIASTREEYYPKSGFLPLAHNFGCKLKDDVKRRDFTINTIAIELTNDSNYKLIDYCSGLEDLKTKTIRILHKKSFIDDPSRIIRAIKFQMRLDFNIDKLTQTLMLNYLDNPDNTIPLERIKNELHQYFEIDNNSIYKNIMDKKVYKLLTDNPYKHFDKAVFNEISAYFDNIELRIIYFLLMMVNSDFENPRLNLTGDEKKILFEVRELINQNILDDNFIIYKTFKNKNEYSLVIYYLMTKDSNVIKFLKELKNIKLEINGNDLINMGLKPSAIFNTIFERILKEKTQGKIQTKEDEIKFAQKIINTL